MKRKTKAIKESSEVLVNFSERERRHTEIQRKLAEAYPMVGGASDDSLWRSLTTNQDRDLNQLTQRRMQDIAFYLYDSNPMAGRIIEIIEDFVIGDGFTYSAKVPEVKEVLDDFWNDPDNNLDEEMNVNVVELFLFGELCLPVWVNSANGAVKLGYIDPKTILKIKKDPNNPKINQKLLWKKPSGQVERELDIINVDRNLKSKTYERLIGDCFYFTVNKVSSATRGRSTLLRLADWLDGFDQFLFARLERAFLLNNFIWDVQCEGMNKGELEEFVKTLATPRPGSIRAHNEKVTWKSETPKLESADASEEARLFKNQILGGAGFPEHWFAEGSRTTRACYSEDTETLTENGWKKYWEIKKGEKLATFNPVKDRIEFYKPKGNIYLYDYKGEMYHFKNERTDILVTPEHRMWIKEGHSTKWQIIQAKDIKYQRFYIKEGAKNWIGKKQKYFELPYIAYDIQSRIKDTQRNFKMENWVNFLGWYLSEGYLNQTKGQFSVRIAQKKKNNVKIIRNLLEQLGFKATESDNGKGVTVFSINNKSLWTYLKENVGCISKEKRIPKDILQLDKSYLEILFRSMMSGDGSWDKRIGRNCFVYATNSNQLANDFQIVCLLLGYSSRQSISTKGKFCWNVISGSKIIERDLCNKIQMTRGKRYLSHIQKEQYNGKVYCFSMPYQFMITRRNGKIAIQLQTATEMGLPTLKNLKSKQKKVKFIIKRMFNFVIDQAIIAGTLSRDIDRSFKVIPSPIVSRDNKGTAEAMNGLMSGLQIARQNNWIDDKKAKTVLNAVITQLGVDMESDVDEEIEKEEPENEA